MLRGSKFYLSPLIKSAEFFAAAKFFNYEGRPQ